MGTRLTEDSLPDAFEDIVPGSVMGGVAWFTVLGSEFAKRIWSVIALRQRVLSKELECSS